MLVWLHHRVRARILRQNSPIKNGQRLTGLTEMVHLVMDNPNPAVHLHMKDSLIAMYDLSEDEQSPRHGFSESQVLNDIGEAHVAYSVAMGLFGHLRPNRQHGEPNETGEQNEQNENEESEDMEDGEEQRYHRYLQSSLSEVSDPDEWMQLHHESEDDRYRRYMVSERHEVSDPEFWDEQFNAIMEENESIARGDYVPDDDEFEKMS